MRMASVPVIISPYSPAWPLLFESERAALQEACPRSRFLVEHIGSTAVPGLAAQPIVDIMLGVDSLDEIDRHLGAIEAMGYEYMPMPCCRSFAKPANGLVHLHVVPVRQSFWNECVLFRNELRMDAVLAREYGALKHRLAEQFCDDQQGYADAKGPFIAAVLQRARLRMRPLELNRFNFHNQGDIDELSQPG